MCLVGDAVVGDSTKAPANFLRHSAVRDSANGPSCMIKKTPSKVILELNNWIAIPASLMGGLRGTNIDRF
ncbi:hypothetical protein NXC24_PB00278 (plasmid) [Rhizobium sp. NXC24]|nr:hypothetical protein NXC24_PB00278 [Rhizobium sp. NXC24]